MRMGLKLLTFAGNVDILLTATGYEVLADTFKDVEKYLRDKDNEVDRVVNDMGDENYIPWSERIRAEGMV